ncbi:M1 family aminopeptidase [Aquimarina litoralis]|uniref:M1 family aminopeptidase n=1 Tax=Aquimarina litoralis TaxID=584605 RepID=UPI001C599047|nr:M1 family aminopeptidase [Aquimarina litoralis]MBW1296584.1 hypothetical protein [Aquimarina litoralis]
MKKTLFLLFVSVILYACSNRQKDIVSYTISPFQVDSIPSIKVLMEFEADKGRTTKLRFQDEAWGEKDLHNSIHHMNLVNIKGTVTKNRDSNWIEINHTKGIDKIQFEYVLKQDVEGDLAAQNRYRPMINNNYFHIFSHNMFMLPDHIVLEKDSKFDVVMNWNDFPEDYMIHNSFGSNEKHQDIIDVNEEEFHSAIFVGGDFRTHINTINNNELIFATRGDWIPFDEVAVSDLLHKTVKAQRNFWKDHSQKYFTVTMIPFPLNQGSSFGGTGLTNSFATSVSNNNQTSIKQLSYLFNHELMHNWIGHKIKNENEEEEYWFSEGFTDYYTQKNIAKNKILEADEGDFINEMNITIKNLYASPVATVPNSEITYDNFWSDRNYEKLPYYRGSVLAFLLDLKIKKESNNQYSLDDVMRDLLEQSKNKEVKLNSKIFIHTVNKYLPQTIDVFFHDHIEKGKLFDLISIFNDFGLIYTPKAKVFEQGFSYDQKTNIVTNVIENSAAYKAGLRTNDILKSWSIYYGNIEKEVALKVDRNGSESQISFLPVKEIELPQLLVNPQNIEVINL